MPLTVKFPCLVVVVSAILLLLCSSTSCLGMNQYKNCLLDTFACDDIEFRYPFGKNGSGCGDPEFQLLPCDYESHAVINIGGNEYHILESSFLANSSIFKILRIVNNNLFPHKCNLSGNYAQFWQSGSHFQIMDSYTNITLWKHCDDPIPDMIYRLPVYNLSFCEDDWHYSFSPLLQQTPFCNAVQIPISKNLSEHLITSQILQGQGFEVTWHVDPNRYQSCEDCLNSKGTCGFNISRPTSFLCYCPDGTSHPDKCPNNGTEDTGGRNMSAIAIGCIVAGVAVTVIALASVLFSRYKAKARKRRNPPTPQILQGNGNDLAIPPWSFNSYSAPETEKCAR